MVRRILIVGIVAVVCAVFPTPAVALTCTVTEIVTGLCTVGGGTTGTGVDVWIDGSTSGGSAGGSAEVDCNETADNRCVGVSPPKDVDKPESVHDLESFRPRAPSQSSEPRGWTIAGLPTNFLSRASTHVVVGELAGHRAEVRFIPIRYRRTFGDGHTRSTGAKGAAWSTAWSPTRTSHVYDDTGSREVRLTVTYLAEYRFTRGPWIRLSGTVYRAAPPLTLEVYSATTLLVARPCTETAIGCP